MNLLRSSFAILVVPLLCCAPVLCFAQAAAASAPAQDASAPAVTFKAEANLVLVDVVVSGKGEPTNGMKQEQFHVSEGGKALRVAYFEEHKPEDPSAFVKAPDMGPSVYGDFPQFADTSAANVLLLDALNTATGDQMYARAQMIKYLKNIPPGTRIAIFTLASKLRMAQGFTTDPALLQKAIAGKEAPKESPLRDAGADQPATAIASLGAAQEGASSLQQFQSDLKSYQDVVRVQTTLDAMQELARYLSVIPGRKNLIWFAGSIPLVIDPGATLNGVFRDTASFADDMRITDEMFSAARVAVYPVDARGLLPMRGAGGIGGDPNGPGISSRSLARTVSNPSSEMSFLTTLGDEHATMERIAQDTGGKAFVDTNDLKGAVAEAVENGGHYYTIGYVPKIEKYDHSFHHIKVTVEGKYDVAYRRGYYAEDPDKQPIKPAVAQNPMNEAMERGAPVQSQILFKVRVLPASDPAAKAVAVSTGQGGTSQGGPGQSGMGLKNYKGPIKRYVFDYAVDAHPFAASAPDGLRHARLEFVLVAFDADGKRINNAARGVAFKISPASYEQLLRTGIQMHQELDLPSGSVTLRAVVRDVDGARIGSTEIPITVAKD